MNVSIRTVSRCATLLASALVFATGCARTSRDTVLSSDTLKVVAVTESRLDINVSKYRHYTTFEVYVDGGKLSSRAFSGLLQEPAVADDHIVHSDVAVLDDNAILLASHTRDSSRCWTTRLSAGGGNVALETLMTSTVDCAIRPAPPGWKALYEDAGDLILVREHPFQIHPVSGYWYVLWIEGDVVALYRKDREHERLIVRLAQISSDTTLAEHVLPMQKYAEPDLLDASPAVRRRWLFDNFIVSMVQSPSLQLRGDNTLETLTPEVWAEYQAIDRQNRALDARARAAGEAWAEAQRRELMERDAAGKRATQTP